MPGKTRMILNLYGSKNDVDKKHALFFCQKWTPTPSGSTNYFGRLHITLQNLMSEWMAFIFLMQWTKLRQIQGFKFIPKYLYE